jgi:hypothetical protein
MKLTTHLLVLRSRKRGSIHPLPDTSSFTFTFILILDSVSWYGNVRAVSFSSSSLVFVSVMMRGIPVLGPATPADPCCLGNKTWSWRKTDTCVFLPWYLNPQGKRWLRNLLESKVHCTHSEAGHSFDDDGGSVVSDALIDGLNSRLFLVETVSVRSVPSRITSSSCHYKRVLRRQLIEIGVSCETVASRRKKKFWGSVTRHRLVKTQQIQKTWYVP